MRAREHEFDVVVHSGRDKAQLTRLIRALRDRKLLEARADEADKRRHSHGAVAAEAALAGLPGADREQLLALLEKVRANLDAAGKD